MTQIILMTQMTNQKKTELIDFFDLVWTKNPQFLEHFLKMEAIFSQNSPPNRTLETSIRHKNSEKGPTFSSKIPERVDIETLQWHTLVRKYYESPPGVSRCGFEFLLPSRFNTGKEQFLLRLPRRFYRSLY